MTNRADAPTDQPNIGLVLAPHARFELLHGDCRHWLPKVASASVHAVVTDPPYHLAPRRARGAHQPTDRPAAPHARARVGDAGFMGQQWDGGDIAFQSDMWRDVLRTLKPGGHLLCFGSPRTSHRMVSAIEDAGFEILNTVLWVYANGFAKSKNLRGADTGRGTALKPAFEPITLARKPLHGSVAANVALHEGCGALNIDACRVADSHHPVAGRGTGSTWKRIHHGECRSISDIAAQEAHGGGDRHAARPDDRRTRARGRWPANVIHDGSPEVEEALHCDSLGSAAKFFYCPKTSRTDRNEGCDDIEPSPLLWSSGVQNPGAFQSGGTERAARNFHPTVKPTALMRYLCRLVTPDNGIVLDPFAGSGSTGKAAMLEGLRFIGIEREAPYVDIARHRIDFARRIGFQLSLPDLQAPAPGG